MGRPIKLSDIPEQKRGTKGTPIRDEIMVWYEGKAPAYELKEYVSANSARTAVSKINQWMHADGMSAKAMARDKTVYIVREQPAKVAPKRRARR
jgi:hypothetical protein